MSRIGKAPINIPAGVEITVSDRNLVTVKGKNATLTQQINVDLSVEIAEGVLTVKRPTEQKRHKAMHGLYRSLIANMVEGVYSGFKKRIRTCRCRLSCIKSGSTSRTYTWIFSPYLLCCTSRSKGCNGL